MPVLILPKSRRFAGVGARSAQNLGLLRLREAALSVLDVKKRGER